MKKKILIVEDMEGIRDSLEVILDIEGYTVEHAENGKEGIKMLEAGAYDLVITDILMPEVDGTEVIMAAAKLPSTKSIAISGGGGGVTAEQALAVAQQTANGILEKPFSSEELKALINQVLA